MIRSVPWRAARSSARSWTRNSSGRVRLRRRPRSPCRLAALLRPAPSRPASGWLRQPRRQLILVDVEGADRDRRRAPCLRACRDRSRTADPRRAMSSTPLVSRNSDRYRPMPFGAGVARRRQIVGELDVGVEPDAARRRRSPPAAAARPRPSPPAGDRRRGCARARELLRRRIEDHFARACRR